MVEGKTRAEIDRLTGHDPKKPAPSMRPVDAATLLLLDREGSDWRVLMGKRHMRHAFMPGKFVFPGGRADKHDGDIAAASELRETDTARLRAGMGAKPSNRRARALAVCAIRETHEETGLLIGAAGERTPSHPDWTDFAGRGLAPALAPLRYVARAVTPPGRTRRFDTRFFAAMADSIAHSLPEFPSGELESLQWLTFDEALAIEAPPITHTVIALVRDRLASDPKLEGDMPVPGYFMRHGKFVRDMV
ncbi:MAG TPA: NUDIX domain-containing protein [Rhizobiaceae bacterium]|nr:NUDIX domain-containing protein [Rhizobiaceae bacterium]